MPPSKTSFSFWPALIGLGAIAVLVAAIAIALALHPAVEAPQSPTIAVPPPPATASWPSGVPATMNPEDARLTEEAAPVQTQLAEIQLVTVSPPPTGRPPTYTPAPFRTGIREVSDVPFPKGSYAIATLWSDIVNGERTLVYSGARKDSSGATPVVRQGLVVVEVYATDLSQKNYAEYEASGATGVLWIVAANGYRLTLTGAGGATLYFDVPTRQFVDSLTVTVTASTATPLPLAAPAVTPLANGYSIITSTPAEAPG